jgi:hypothetical protein
VNHINFLINHVQKIEAKITIKVLLLWLPREGREQKMRWMVPWCSDHHHFSPAQHLQYDVGLEIQCQQQHPQEGVRWKPFKHSHRNHHSILKRMMKISGFGEGKKKQKRTGTLELNSSSQG